MNNVTVAVMPKPHAPVEIRQIPEPHLEPNSALLDVALSEVCGTDVHLRDGRLDGVPYPIIPGHVSVGRLAKIRGQLLDIDGKPFNEGDPVTFLDVHKTCNACYHCLVAKATTRCPKRKVYGITYGLNDGLTGGWATKLYLKPGTHIIRLHDVDFQRFMAGGCSLPTALHAIDRANVTIGDTVLVLGSGPVGLSTVIFALLAGAIRVFCIGAPEHRLQTARDIGAHDTLNIEHNSDQQRHQWILNQTNGHGADVTIEATGNPAAVTQAMRYTRDAGRVVIVGQYTDHGTTPFNPHTELNRKHLNVLACWGSDFSHFYRGARIMADQNRSKPWSKLKLRRYPLSAANEALEHVKAGHIVKAIIDPHGTATTPSPTAPPSVPPP